MKISFNNPFSKKTKKNTAPANGKKKPPTLPKGAKANAKTKKGLSKKAPKKAPAKKAPPKQPGAKSAVPVWKRKEVLLGSGVVIGVAAIGVGLAMNMGLFRGNSQPAYDEIPTTDITDTTDTTDTDQNDTLQNEGGLGDTVTTDDGISFTLDKVEGVSEPGMDGEDEEFILFTVTIENGSDSSFEFSPDMFWLTNEQGTEENYDPLAPEVLESDTLEPDETFTGTIGFLESPDQSVTLTIYESEYSDVALASFYVSSYEIETSMGSGSSDDTDDTDSTTSDSQTYNPNEPAEVGESITAENGVTYTLLFVNYSYGDDSDEAPESGMVFLHCKVRIENNTDETIPFDMMDWEITDSEDNSDNVDASAINDAGGSLDSGDLFAGAVMEGLVSFQVSESGTLTLNLIDHEYDGDVMASWIITR